MDSMTSRRILPYESELAMVLALQPKSPKEEADRDRAIRIILVQDLYGGDPARPLIDAIAAADSPWSSLATILELLAYSQRVSLLELLRRELHGEINGPAAVGVRADRLEPVHRFYDHATEEIDQLRACSKLPRNWSVEDMVTLFASCSLFDRIELLTRVLCVLERPIYTTNELGRGVPRYPIRFAKSSEPMLREMLELLRRRVIDRAVADRIDPPGNPTRPLRWEGSSADLHFVVDSLIDAGLLAADADESIASHFVASTSGDDRPSQEAISKLVASLWREV